MVVSITWPGRRPVSAAGVSAGTAKSASVLPSSLAEDLGAARHLDREGGARRRRRAWFRSCAGRSRPGRAGRRRRRSPLRRGSCPRPGPRAGGRRRRRARRPLSRPGSRRAPPATRSPRPPPMPPVRRQRRRRRSRWRPCSARPAKPGRAVRNTASNSEGCYQVRIVADASRGMGSSKLSRGGRGCSPTDKAEGLLPEQGGAQIKGEVMIGHSPLGLAASLVGARLRPVLRALVGRKVKIDPMQALK